MILLLMVTTACASGSTSTSTAPAPNTNSNPSTSTNTSTGAASHQGLVSINFDDGYESAFVSGLPILNQAGFKATEFIITGQLGHPGFITTDQLLAIQAGGHEIGGHTRTHPRLSTLNEDQQRTEILGGYDDLVALGIHPQVFAYPFGDFNGTSVIIARSTFLAARTVNGNLNDKSVNPLLLNAYSIRPDAPVYAFSDIAPLIDAAQSNGTWLILLFHKVDETGDPISVPHDLIQQVVDYLTAHNVKVVTMSDGLRLELGLPAS